MLYTTYCIIIMHYKYVTHFSSFHFPKHYVFMWVNFCRQKKLWTCVSKFLKTKLITFIKTVNDDSPVHSFIIVLIVRYLPPWVILWTVLCHLPPMKKQWMGFHQRRYQKAAFQSITHPYHRPLPHRTHTTLFYCLLLHPTIPSSTSHTTQHHSITYHIPIMCALQEQSLSSTSMKS